MTVTAATPYRIRLTDLISLAGPHVSRECEDLSVLDGENTTTPAYGTPWKERVTNAAEK
jgi:hypothetical protein